MLHDKTLIWTRVKKELENFDSNQNSDPVDTYEVDLVKCCIGLRIRKIKRIRTNRAVVAGFNLTLINWETENETTVTFNNDDPATGGLRIFRTCFIKKNTRNFSV